MIKFKKISPDVKEKIPHIGPIFKKYMKIGLVYLFGSYAVGKITPLSDIDIAYYLTNGEKLGYDEEMQLIGELNGFLQTEEIDLVRLNDAPIGFQYNVVSEAKLIYCSRRELRESYESKVLMDYLDFKPVQELYFNQMFKNIKEDGGGSR